MIHLNARSVPFSSSSAAFAGVKRDLLGVRIRGAFRIAVSSLAPRNYAGVVRIE
ncbi:MAG: hypothetical protein PVG49_07170 [Desulfobacteraceae bacterium]